MVRKIKLACRLVFSAISSYLHVLELVVWE